MEKRLFSIAIPQRFWRFIKHLVLTFYKSEVILCSSTKDAVLITIYIAILYIMCFKILSSFSHKHFLKESYLFMNKYHQEESKSRTGLEFFETVGCIQDITHCCYLFILYFCMSQLIYCILLRPHRSSMYKKDIIK